MEKYSWSLAHTSALIETDPEKVFQRIRDAEPSIFIRSQQEGINPHELEAMGAAAMALLDLRDSHAVAD
jgi:hypothetical protein